MTSLIPWSSGRILAIQSNACWFESDPSHSVVTMDKLFTETLCKGRQWKNTSLISSPGGTIPIRPTLGQGSSPSINVYRINKQNFITGIQVGGYNSEENYLQPVIISFEWPIICNAVQLQLQCIQPKNIHYVIVFYNITKTVLRKQNQQKKATAKVEI